MKEFEIILEQCGKLLKKVLKPYYHTSKAVDKLYYKDIFRQAVLHSVIDPSIAERFMLYRDNRNNTAHDYGVNFTEETLVLLSSFITDSRLILDAIVELNEDVTTRDR